MLSQVVHGAVELGPSRSDSVQQVRSAGALDPGAAQAGLPGQQGRLGVHREAATSAGTMEKQIRAVSPLLYCLTHETLASVDCPLGREPLGDQIANWAQVRDGPEIHTVQESICRIRRCCGLLGGEYATLCCRVALLFQSASTPPSTCRLTLKTYHLLWYTRQFVMTCIFTCRDSFCVPEWPSGECKKR